MLSGVKTYRKCSAGLNNQFGYLVMTSLKSGNVNVNNLQLAPGNKFEIRKRFVSPLFFVDAMCFLCWQCFFRVSSFTLNGKQWHLCGVLKTQPTKKLKFRSPKWVKRIISYLKNVIEIENMNARVDDYLQKSRILKKKIQ